MQKALAQIFLWLLAVEWRFIKDGFGEENSYPFENNEKAWEFIKKELKDGDTVLVSV